MVGLVAGCSPSSGGTDRDADRPPGRATPPASTAGRDRQVCEQGRTTRRVVAEPVPGTPDDLTVRSFDGTNIRIHWYPAAGSVRVPQPTVLMGPGWGQAGAVKGATGVPGSNPPSVQALGDKGYNVLTWDPRGFGASTGTAEVDDPRHEGRDV